MTTMRTASRARNGSRSRPASGPSVTAGTRPAMRASTIGVGAKALGRAGLRITLAMRVATRYDATTRTTARKRIGTYPPVDTEGLQPIDLRPLPQGEQASIDVGDPSDRQGELLFVGQIEGASRLSSCGRLIALGKR